MTKLIFYDKIFLQKEGEVLMLLKFKSVKADNFLSILHSEVELDNQGVVLIKGINNSQGSADSNGSGKSSIVAETIYFALTGETLRGTSEVVNIYSRNNYSLVELEFELDRTKYRLRRTKNHPELGTNLKIYKEEQDISGDKLKKSEAILKEELGEIDSTLISGILILGQGLPDTFTSLKPKERKERLEVLSQSSEFISELELRVAELTKIYTIKLQDNRKVISQKETELRFIRDSRKRDSERLVELYKRESDSESLKEELIQITEEGKLLANQLSEEEKKKDKLDKRGRELEQLLFSSRTLKQNKEQEKLSLESLITKLSESKCPTCVQWINSPEVINSLKEENQRKIKSLEKTIELCINKIDFIEKEINKIKNQIAELNILLLKRKLDSKRNRIIQIKSEIKIRDESTKEQIDLLSDTLENYNKRENQIEIELSSINTLTSEYEIKLDILTWIKKMCTKDFRGYLLSGVIDYINLRLREYSRVLFGVSNLRMILDGSKIYIDYEGRQYEGLSGGEKRLADLCIQFSLRDMLKNTLGFTSNILILDEVFENIDESGVRNIIELINSFSETSSIFVISHSHIDMPHDRVISVIKNLDKTSSVEISY